MFMPFMEAMPISWRTGSPMAVTESESYGSVIRSLREFALKKFDTEPQWRKKGTELLSGYIPDWGDDQVQRTRLRAWRRRRPHDPPGVLPRPCRTAHTANTSALQS
jgi:hypothetical protein